MTEKLVVIKNIHSQVEQKIVNTINATEYENIEYTIKVTIDDIDNVHVLVFIDPFNGDSLIFFLNILGDFYKDNDSPFSLWYDVLSKTDENLMLETVTYI